MAFTASTVNLPTWWAGLLHQGSGAIAPVSNGTRHTAETIDAITHLRDRLREYEQSQPGYASDLRAALAQLERGSAAR